MWVRLLLLFLVKGGAPRAFVGAETDYAEEFPGLVGSERRNEMTMG